MVEVSLRLHTVIAELPRPRFLDDRSDLCAVAWGERDAGELPDGFNRRGLIEDLSEAF